MTRISELPAAAQRVVYGAMSRAVIENLYGTAPFMSADRSFAENVYNQWVGSDQLLKDVPDTELDYWHVIGGALESIHDMHDKYVALFAQAEEAMAPILAAQQEIHMETAVLGAWVPSTHFFSKPDLPSAYKAHIVSILRKVPEIAELELLNDDEDEEASDSDEDESDESDQPDGSDDSDDGEGEEKEGEDQDEDEEEEEEDEEDEEGDDDDSDSEDSDSEPFEKPKKASAPRSKFVLDEAGEGGGKDEAEDSEEEDDEEEGDGAESDGTTESQYWKAEAEEARERMKADADSSSDEETPRSKKARAK